MTGFNLDNVTFEEGTEVQQNAFCGIWETARPALDILVLVIRNPIAKWIIGLVIMVGDKVKEKVCSTT